VNNIICIAGPTASGKTAFAVELAKVYDDKKASSFANGILGKIVAEK